MKSMAIWTAEIKEIEKLHESFLGQLPELEKELEQLIKTDDANVILLYSRRCLEVIVSDLCESELKRPRKTEPLKGIIDKLHKEEKVPSHIITSMHGLNELSTYGAHPKDYDPVQVKPVLNNLFIVLKWYVGYKDLMLNNLKTAREESWVVENETQVKKAPFKRIKASILLQGLFLTLIITVSLLVVFKVINLGGIPEAGKSIAVLPFTNLGNDPEQEWLSVGFVDEILDKLFKLGGLKVIARTSSERFKNTNLSLKEVARKLNVTTIMEGSVRKQGNNIRITVQLIDARTEAHLWSEIYDRDLSDVFSIQSDVAKSVARELKAVITPDAKQFIDKKATTNMEAWEAYWRGMLHYNKLNKEDMDIAMKYFELAKEEDPEFALAYVGMGRVWRGLQQMSIIKVSEAAAKAEEFALKAVEMDSTYSEVHHLLGGIRTWTNWDWKGGEESFRKAIELNPQNADAHSTYSHLLSILGRYDEAMKHIDIALDLDPFNTKIIAFYGVDLLFARRYDDAVMAFREAMDLSSAQGVADANIIDALSLAGRESEATDMLRSFYKDQESLNTINAGFKEGGFQGAVKRIADLLAERSKTKFVGPLHIAVRYSLAGDIDNAIAWLEKAYEMHDPNLPYLLSPVFDNLRNDVRFQELVRKMNLPYKKLDY